MFDEGDDSPSLRIALIAPPWFAVPPPGYGGIERVVGYLADGLSQRGHRVTLFASGGSHSAAEVVSPFAVPPSRDLGDPLVESQHLVEAYSRWREFDVIHDHTTLGLIAGSALPVPVVHTIHGPIISPVAGLLERVAGGVELLCVSHHQRTTLPPACTATVIHNAIVLDQFPLGTGAGGYLLFVGRMTPDKGVLEAIAIARGARLPLKLIAKVNEEPERRYFEDVVLPAARAWDVEILFQPSQAEKAQAYGEALATLFPIRWPEPFGLVMAESMAAGTPVIAFPEGAAPEVVADGVTGFLCATVDEAVDAVARVRELSRMACRHRVAEHFSAEVAVARHEAFYLTMLEAAVRPPSVVTPAAWANSSPVAGSVA